MTVLFLFVVLFVLMFLGVPIAISLGLSSVLTILLFSQDSLASFVLKLYESSAGHYTLLAIPFFILSSAFLSTGGVAKRMIDFANCAVGHVAGGLAIASVVACMIFAAVSGSSPATVAAIGGLVIAGMERAGYPKALAAGLITNAGTLGILIPPSIVMLVYASATEVSAAKMFVAGLIPGLLMGGILIVAIYIVAKRKKLPKQPFAGLRSLLSSAWSALGGLFMIVLILGIIYGGVASPTEAGAVAVIYAYFIVTYGYRDVGVLRDKAWRNPGESLGCAVLRNSAYLPYAFVASIGTADIRRILFEAAKTSIMLLFIIVNAMLFAHILTTERIPQILVEQILAMNLPVWGFLIAVNVILLIAGNFMEPSAIILILAPIFFPIAVRLGIDPVHLGIIMVVNMEIGLLTPPVGLNLFVTSGITGESLGWVVRATMPWLVLLLCFLILVTYVPSISLFLLSVIDV